MESMQPCLHWLTMFKSQSILVNWASPFNQQTNNPRTTSRSGARPPHQSDTHTSLKWWARLKDTLLLDLSSRLWSTAVQKFQQCWYAMWFGSPPPRSTSLAWIQCTGTSKSGSRICILLQSKKRQKQKPKQQKAKQKSKAKKQSKSKAQYCLNSAQTKHLTFLHRTNSTSSRWSQPLQHADSACQASHRFSICNHETHQLSSPVRWQRRCFPISFPYNEVSRSISQASCIHFKGGCYPEQHHIACSCCSDLLHLRFASLTVLLPSNCAYYCWRWCIRVPFTTSLSMLCRLSACGQATENNNLGLAWPSYWE